MLAHDLLNGRFPDRGPKAVMSSIRFDRPQQPASTGLSKPQRPRSWEANPTGTTTLVPGVNDGPGPGLRVFLSVVIPARNESASLPQLVGEIANVLRPLCKTSRTVAPERLYAFEIIIVDDGSTDITPRVLEQLARVYSE